MTGHTLDSNVTALPYQTVTSLTETIMQLPVLHIIFIQTNGGGCSVLKCCWSSWGTQGSPHQQTSAAVEMSSEELLESEKRMKQQLSNQEVKGFSEI